jgi:hypothetical protein
MGDHPYSRISRDSITDDQLERLIRIVDLAERDANNHEGSLLFRLSEVRDHYRQDVLALRELHALLVSERQERIIDLHERD